jgi:hypothetical protein
MVAIRRIRAQDLSQIGRFAFTVSITEPLTDAGRLSQAFEDTGFWQEEAGAVAIVETVSGRLLGTASSTAPDRAFTDWSSATSFMTPLIVDGATPRRPWRCSLTSCSSSGPAFIGCS